MCNLGLFSAAMVIERYDFCSGARLSISLHLLRVMSCHHRPREEHRNNDHVWLNSNRWIPPQTSKNDAQGLTEGLGSVPGAFCGAFPAQKTGRGRTTPSQAAPILSSFGKFLDALHRKHWCFPHLMSLLTMFKPPPTNVSVILHASPLLLLLLPSTLLPCPSSPSQTCIFHPHSNSMGMTFEKSHP